MASDVVTIPVQPSPLDVWGTRPVIALLADARAIKPDLKSAFAVMRKVSNTAIGRDVTEALATYQMRVFATAIAQRVAFPESIARGLTVFGVDPTGRGSAEVAALTHEIKEFANGEKGSHPDQGRKRRG